jgi:hypothetical protein
MKASTRQLSAVPATPEEHGNRADVRMMKPLKKRKTRSRKRKTK